jgi:ribosomal protein L11 methyltransferase
MAHIEVQFSNTTEEINNILVALLAESDYEGFEEETNGLRAFIQKDLFSKKTLEEIATRFQLQYTTHELADTNWNKVWESNFQPVVVNNFCGIRADFHEPLPGVRHEIIITPKMSFGTGHHATTFMMIRQMEDIDFTGKKVLDFGTGTGVLAILAYKSGAANISAIDNDDWSIDNAKENFTKNNADHINLQKADNADTAQVFDIILANITRNVILDNFSFFNSSLADKGILVLSGLLDKDEEHIIKEAKKYQLHFDNELSRDNWISLRFSK